MCNLETYEHMYPRIFWEEILFNLSFNNGHTTKKLKQIEEKKFDETLIKIKMILRWGNRHELYFWR